MRSKDQALMKLFHQLLETEDNDQIQDLLGRIHILAGRLTPDRRAHCHHMALAAARKKAIRDMADHDPTPAQTVMLEGLNSIEGGSATLGPVNKAAMEGLSHRLQMQLEEIEKEERPQRVQYILQQSLREVEVIVDHDLQQWGYALLRAELEELVLDRQNRSGGGVGGIRLHRCHV